MPSIRFLIQKGICPKGLEAFDEYETKSNINQQVSNFSRQEDGERSIPQLPNNDSFWTLLLLLLFNTRKNVGT